MLRILGVLLICLGLFGFFIGDVSFTTEETVADVGPVEVEEQDRTSFPVTPVASGAILVLGAGLFYVGHRRAKKE